MGNRVGEAGGRVVGAGLDVGPGADVSSLGDRVAVVPMVIWAVERRVGGAPSVGVNIDCLVGCLGLVPAQLVRAINRTSPDTRPAR